MLNFNDFLDEDEVEFIFKVEKKKKKVNNFDVNGVYLLKSLKK